MYDTLFDPKDIPDEFMDCFDVVETQCGSPWVREVDVDYGLHPQRTTITCNPRRIERTENKSGYMNSRGDNLRRNSETTGWHPSCPHDLPPIPATCLDPFAGSGTVGVVAEALKRRFIGLDLNAKYLRMATRRINRPHARAIRPEKKEPEHHPLFKGLAND